MSTHQNPVVNAIINGTAPKPARLAAARGILPLSQLELLEILSVLVDDPDEEISITAKSTLNEQVKDPNIIDSLKAPDISEKILAYLAKLNDIPASIQEAVITNPKTPDEAIIEFVKNTTNGSLLELIAINQQRLIRYPALIEAIIENPNRTAEAERRARETKREFFEKERGAQQIANELRAQGKTAAAEFIEQSEFIKNLSASELSLEDAFSIAQHVEIPDAETDDSWLSLELIEEVYEETSEQRQAAINKIMSELGGEPEGATAEKVALIVRIMKMNVKDRIKLAMKGDREVRGILIRDPNRVVAQAVIQNPRITEQEIEKIAAMRTVPEEILRQIASNRHWAKLYPIIHNLVRNPRTPIAISMNILPRLHVKDLEALGKNRNIPDAIRTQAFRLSKTRRSM
ncbi:MAG: hypothetical protein D6735_06175 [Acidobacteria bacterium]|nr:MAG: hypothetical protein D6735_06175 [Acidobacteriota bacterium]